MLGMELLLHSPYRRRLGGRRWQGLAGAGHGRPLPRRPPRRRRYSFARLLSQTLRQYQIIIRFVNKNWKKVIRQTLTKENYIHAKNRAFLRNVHFVKGNLSNHIYIYLTVMNIAAEMKISRKENVRRIEDAVVTSADRLRQPISNPVKNML